ncbi:TM2 domain-containing protein [Microcella flavibacter]|uniref:TM2 domain-containing protein n=1 Tax=Microcella flavibacter TaxID=1804990 RepID=UPI001456CC70|nr:TM2 domain-containing protein [Microcella flavibacter]
MTHPAPQATATDTGRPAARSFVITWLLALLLGAVGADRFYLGKIGTGLLKLLTFGGLGIWALVDLILVLTGNQRDKQNRPLEGYRERRTLAWAVTGAFLLIAIIIGATTGGGRDTDPVPAAAPATAEAEPVEEPEVSEPEPDPAPEPAEPTVQDWADDNFGVFDPITQSGAGDSIIALPAGVTAGVVTASHDGARNFVLSVLDAGNQSTGDLLVNTIGAYTGTTAYGLASFGEGTSIQITADGSWSITIAPMSAAAPIPAAGSGDGVFLYEGPAGALALTHAGERNFVVIQDSARDFEFGLLVNDIGPYTGTVPMMSGPSVITITADGAWTAVTP